MCCLFLCAPCHTKRRPLQLWGPAPPPGGGIYPVTEQEHSTRCGVTVLRLCK